MKKISLFDWTVVVVGLALAITAWFFWAYDEETLRYRLTYVVEDNGMEHTGSSVVEVRYKDTSRIPFPGLRSGPVVSGEAVTIDLGDGRYLFSLLGGKGPGPVELPIEVFGQGLSQGGSAVRWARQLNADKPETDLAAGQLPQLISFGDLHDPKSVVPVDPEDLAAAFGQGVALKQVHLEITDEPVTKGVVGKLLPCLDSGEFCIPLNLYLPYGDPMRLILNGAFRKGG